MSESNSFEEILNKIKALGIHQGVDNLRTKQNKAIAIDKIIAGFYEDNEFGQTFIKDEIFPNSYNHGNVAFSKTFSTRFEFISKYSNIDFYHKLVDHTLFFDTETSGLSGGAGTFIFLAGYGYFTLNGFVLKQFFMPDPGSEQSLLQSMGKFLPDFNFLVSFNGRSFDEPMMNNRYRIYGLPSPLSSMQHFDMLHIARKLWKLRLPSRALKDLEVEILRLQRSSEEIPGWMVPEIYAEYLHTGDASPLAGVFYHNAMDILSLAALTLHVGEVLDEIDGDITMPPEDLYSVALMCRNDGQVEKACKLLEICMKINPIDDVAYKAITLYADLRKKEGDYVTAAKFWETAVQRYADWVSSVELAKYYEHHKLEYHTAIQWTDKAIELLLASTLPEYKKDSQYQELQNRLKRLVKKRKMVNN